MGALKSSACILLGCSLLVACAEPGSDPFSLSKKSSSSSTAVNSCGDDPDQSSVDNEMIGTLVGIGLGALVGSRFGGGMGTVMAAATAAAIGGLVGNRIGSALDERSRQCHASMIKSAVNHPEKGQQTWRLDDQNASGTVTPLRSFNQDGKQCTEVMQTVVKNGKTISDTGSYCKETDGSVTLLN